MSYAELLEVISTDVRVQTGKPPEQIIASRTAGQGVEPMKRPLCPYPHSGRSVLIISDTDQFTVDESWLSTAPKFESRLGLSSTLAAHERAMIEDALRASGGRVFGNSGAAARLGIPRSTLESKIRTLKINKNRFRTQPAKAS